MEIKRQELIFKAIKFEAVDDGKMIGRAFLYLIYNNLHKEPYGLLEDVFVDREYRNQGIGNQLVKAVIEEAKELRCYKLVGTSRYARPKVHAWYERLGFKDYGKEFRLNL